MIIFLNHPPVFLDGEGLAAEAPLKGIKQTSDTNVTSLRNVQFRVGNAQISAGSLGRFEIFKRPKKAKSKDKGRGRDKGHTACMIASMSKKSHPLRDGLSWYDVPHHSLIFNHLRY